MGEKQIFILFTDTNSWLTKLIKYYTKKPYNHVSIAFDHQLNEVYSFGRKKSSNPFIGGFVRERMLEGLFKEAQCAVYSYTLSESEYNRMKWKVTSFEAEKDFYKYNFLGLFAIMFNLNLKRKKAFFCSEFVATILKEKNGILEKSPNLCTPQDLMDIDQLQLIYQGSLHSYPSLEKSPLETEVNVSSWRPKLRFWVDFS